MSFKCFNTGSIKIGQFFAVIYLIITPVAGFCQDSNVPVGTSININSGETYTVSRSVSISLSANDPGGGITGYYLSEDNTALSGETLPAFSIVASTQVLSITANFTLSEDDGTKIVYVWFKDAANNISSVISDSIILDRTAPVNGAVKINDDSGSVTSSQVTVTITATDSYNIAGYRVSESSSAPMSSENFTLLETPVASLNTSFSFNLSTTTGTKTLYAWFIDEAGNISAPSTCIVDFAYGWFRYYDIGAEDDIPGLSLSTHAYEMTMDNSGNIYIVGITHGDIGEDKNNTLYGSAFVARLNSAGEVVWSRLLEATYRNEGDSYCYSSKGEHIAVDIYGNVYIAGGYDYMSYEYPDAFLAKFDSSGNQVWLKRYSREYADYIVRVRDISVDGSNNVYLLAYSNGDVELGTLTITYDYNNGTGKFLAKYNSNGNLAWAFSSEDLVGQGAMAVDESGNIFMAGDSEFSNDLLLSRFTSDGVKIWTREWGYSANYHEYCEDLTLDSYGNLYIAGFLFPEGSDLTSSTAFVGKFDSNGDAEASGQWYYNLPLDNADNYMLSHGVALDSKGYVYITGEIRRESYGSSYPDTFIRKYSPTGTLIWTKRLGDGGIEGETPANICIGYGDFVFILGNHYNQSIPGWAGQKYFYNINYQDTFIWKSSSDSLLDLTLPTGSFTINNADTTVMGNVVTLNLSASDNIGVTGYYVSESDMLPAPGFFTMIDETTGFSSDIQYTFETITPETKTVYVWYRDAFGNYSNPRASASIEMTGDTEAPVGGTPVIDGGAEKSMSTTVSIDISATDNVAVTGYYVSEEFGTPTAGKFTAIDTPSQSFSKTVSYTLTDTAPGVFAIYVYFIDVAGNVSNYASAYGNLADTTPPVTTADPASGYYDAPVTVTLNATDDYYLLFTYYTVESENEFRLYSAPFQVTPPDRVAFLSVDLNNNLEAVKIVTYGLAKSFSGSISAGTKGSLDIEAAHNPNMKISFSLEEMPHESVTVVLKQPDGTVYEAYFYTGDKLEIFITGAAGGLWSLEIDNSRGDTVLNYQINTKQLPTDGCIDGSDFDGDGTVDCEEECPFDPEKTEAGSCGCGIEDIDTDSDGIMDCVDTDDDNDGMPDEWEEANGLDPLYDDASEDPDGDGFKNLLEYKRGTDPQDSRSHPPRAMPWLPLLLGDD